MQTGNVSRMSCACNTAIVLLLFFSMGESKPVASSLGAGVNLFNLLSHLHEHSSEKRMEEIINAFSSSSIFINPRILKWEKKKNSDEGDSFRVILCENVQELYRALDGKLKIEGIDSSAINRQLDSGLPPKFLKRGYFYLLVRFTRVKMVTNLQAASSISSTVEEALSNLKEGHLESVLTLFNQFGTHFVSSYTIGESIYQVHAYRSERLDQLKRKLKTADSLDLSKLKDFVSPLYVDYVGAIKTSSGDETIVSWSNSLFHTPLLLRRYIEMLRDPNLFAQFSKQLDLSQTLLKVDLSSLERAIENPARKRIFKEALDNQMNLFETNM